jgi:hypothetical protein
MVLEDLTPNMAIEHFVAYRDRLRRLSDSSNSGGRDFPDSVSVTRPRRLTSLKCIIRLKMPLRWGTLSMRQDQLQYVLLRLERVPSKKVTIRGRCLAPNRERSFQVSVTAEAGAEGF